METKANYLLIGTFIVAGFLGILGFLMWFARIEINRQFDYYDVFFPEVSGLGVASEVRFAGLPVGKVIGMGLSPAGDGTVRVEIEVRQGTPVRRDSVATLDMQGVTGVAAVGISAGSPGQPLLKDDETEVPVIPVSRSTLQALGDEGPQIIERLAEVSARLTELLGPDNQGRVANILGNLERSTGHLDAALNDVSTATAAVRDVAAGMEHFAAQVDTLGATATTTLHNTDAALAKVSATAGELDAMLAAGAATLTTIQTYVAGDLTALTQRLDAATAAVQGDVAGLRTRLATSLDGVDATLAQGPAAVAAATRAFEGADRMMNTDLGPVIADLRGSLAGLSRTLASLDKDLPGIMTKLRGAADSAEAAFASLRNLVDGARTPLQSFLGDGLTQFSLAAKEIRGLVKNMDQLVTTLKRNPAQILSGPKAPEYRR